jgi:menaquinone-dependent protoporphyrinogen oxidase
MNEKSVIIYSTVDGQTLKICNKLKEQFEEQNQKVSLFSVDGFTENLSDYDKIIIGASIRYGVHNKSVIEFINKNKKQLDTKNTVFFSVNLVARKPEKNSPDTNPYVIKFFKNIDWNPTLVEVFAGNLDYQKYPLFDRIMIQFIMWITKGPTDSKAKIEYTNWDRVKEFGIKISKL